MMKMPNLEKLLNNNDLKFSAAIVLSTIVKEKLLSMTKLDVADFSLVHDLVISSILQKKIYGQNNFKKLLMSICINIILDAVVGPLVPKTLLKNEMSQTAVKAAMLMVSLHLSSMVKNMEMMLGISLAAAALIKSGMLDKLPSL